MQDYIRLRGRVLLHILACIVDPNEAIQMKAVAAILNYANDKNSNILHTSFLECAMIFNECTDYQNQNLFPSNELDRTRILYGPANEERRHQLYQFLTHNIFVLNEFQILVLFKHIVSFNIKLARKEMIRSENGVQAMKDILKIFVIICKKRQESKSKPLEKSESNEVEETMSRYNLYN